MFTRQASGEALGPIGGEVANADSTAMPCVSTESGYFGRITTIVLSSMVRGPDSGKMAYFWGDGFRLDGEIGEWQLNGR